MKNLTLFGLLLLFGLTIGCNKDDNGGEPEAKVISPGVGITGLAIGIGNTKAEVMAAYGDPVSSSQFFGDEYAIGITFVYEDGTDLVESIVIE